MFQKHSEATGPHRNIPMCRSPRVPPQLQSPVLWAQGGGEEEPPGQGVGHLPCAV